jgi:predicted solute-binding protein
MDRIWSDIHQSEQIKGELLHNFELSSDQILSEFANAKENLEQKLLNFEYVRIQGDIKKLLGSKQEELNNYLGKLQYEVDNKTEMNEFKGALR